jgi:hypothetical protein
MVPLGPDRGDSQRPHLFPDLLHLLQQLLPALPLGPGPDLDLSSSDQAEEAAGTVRKDLDPYFLHRHVEFPRGLLHGVLLALALDFRESHRLLPPGEFMISAFG